MPVFLTSVVARAAKLATRPEDWHLHHPRPLQDQDPCQASHKGWNQAHVRQGGQGQGPSSQNCCKGFPSCCSQGSALSHCAVRQPFLSASQRSQTCGNPTARFGSRPERHCTSVSTPAIEKK